jgi:TATA-binding protein-associated factor Taf7
MKKWRMDGELQQNSTNIHSTLKKEAEEEEEDDEEQEKDEEDEEDEEIKKIQFLRRRIRVKILKEE